MSESPTLQRRTDLAQQAQEMAKIDRAVLYRRQALGETLTFEVGAETFDRVFFFLGRLNAKSLVLVPPDSFEAIARFVQKMGSKLGEIQSFSTANGEPLRIRNAIIAGIDDEFRNLTREHPMVMLAVLPTSLEDSDEVETLRLRVKEFDDFTAKSRLALGDQIKSAEEIVNTLREASGKVAVKKYSEYFDTEAKNAGGAARQWLWATVTVGVMLFGVLGSLVFLWNPEDRSPSQLVQSGGAKVALFTVGFYLLSWCGRNYKALRHIYVVNKHRANTLNSMEAYANAVNKQDVRDAILIQASAAIFAQASTGFIPDQSDSPSSPTVLEIIRGKES